MTGKSLRCAIYTRKSSEEGLEQGFNSLQAQREACEAYVLSQAGEGWSAVKTAYDDGGFSGGSMDRPGLRQLLADVTAGKIDVVVVYKVDRLTRSLADFAKIVDAFDAKGVSFVSVTQAFNTTTSMGRLTLNVLLSFAQFEREVTGERIRDKIAASKAKGMWMGGPLPLGYDAPTDRLTRALVVNSPEAETVRLIFRQYLEIGSVHGLRDWLDDQGIRSKSWTTRKGRSMGGAVFSRGALFHLLKNRTYLGEIVHRAQTYPGAHAAIIDREVFDAVQARLADQAAERRERPTRVSTMVLRGILFDADGEPMSPSFTYRPNGRTYRYYVSAPLLQGRRPEGGGETIRRAPASAIEGLVTGLVRRLSFRPNPDLRACVDRVEVHATTVQVVLRRPVMFHRPSDAVAELQRLSDRLEPGERIVPDPTAEDLVRLTVPCRLKFHGGKIWISGTDGRPPIRTGPDLVLIRALQAAHRVLAEVGANPIGRPELAFLDRSPTRAYERNLVRLAFLAPDIQAMILEGRQPASLNLQTLMFATIPADWAEQRRSFGIAA